MRPSPAELANAYTYKFSSCGELDRRQERWEGRVSLQELERRWTVGLGGDYRSDSHDHKYCLSIVGNAGDGAQRGAGEAGGLEEEVGYQTDGLLDK
jgi:hypothetical protein